MKYVKIKGTTYNEAMMKLRMEYGEDAIPVSHKNIKEGGLFNSAVFAKNFVELTAAIPEKRTSKEKILKKTGIDFTVGGDMDLLKETTTENILAAAQKSKSMSVNDNNIISKPVQKENRDSFEDILKRTSTPEARERSTSDFRKFEKEFQDLKETLQQLIETGGVTKNIKTNYQSEENDVVKSYLDILKDNDFDKEDCDILIQEVKNAISPDDLRDKFKIEKTLKDLLKSRIITSGPIKKGIKKKIIMFIGPTGVGKTTTMAKLGALYSLREGRTVSFITIDTYRIAATEQLKKYANIMKIPIYVVNDHEEFKETIKNEKSEIIMVDTSGRSHKNELKISEIKSYADTVEYDFEKILCVSANTKKSDLKLIFRSFGKIDFDSVIVTKVDETSYIGNVIDVVEKYKKPISYLTNGQEVPNDILIAEPDKIVDMLITGTNSYIGG